MANRRIEIVTPGILMTIIERLCNSLLCMTYSGSEHTISLRITSWPHRPRDHTQRSMDGHFTFRGAHRDLR